MFHISTINRAIARALVQDFDITDAVRWTCHGDGGVLIERANGEEFVLTQEDVLNAHTTYDAEIKAEDLEAECADD